MSENIEKARTFLSRADRFPWPDDKNAELSLAKAQVYATLAIAEALNQRIAEAQEEAWEACTERVADYRESLHLRVNNPFVRGGWVE